MCFDYDVDREGKRVRKSRTFDTKRDATRAFNEHKVKKDRGTQVMPSEYAFAQWLDYWYDNIIVPQIEETLARTPFYEAADALVQKALEGGQEQ